MLYVDIVFKTVVYEAIEENLNMKVSVPAAITANFPTLFIEFSNELSSTLAECFVQKGSMWGHYHLLRSLTTFHEFWMKFVKEPDAKTPSPAFDQHVTHEVHIKFYRTNVFYETINPIFL